MYTQELIQKFNRGEGLTDKELEALILHYSELVDLLDVHGDIYAVVCNHARINLEVLRRFRFHRYMK